MGRRGSLGGSSCSCTTGSTGQGGGWPATDQVLPDRLIVATYRADTLRRWWSEVAAELESQPRNSAEREEVEALLRAEAAPVMETIRTETEALLLRTRITTDAVRAARA